jgi:hypothetical protein
MGNPFFLEHSKEIAPAFFVADWFAALPLLFGFSFNFTIIFNLFFWSAVFALLLYLLLRQFNLPGLFCLLGTVLAYIVAYRLMFRPVSMQTVYPFFLLFLLAFIIWYKNYSNKKRIVFLVLSTTAAFYAYTHLWQIVLVFVLLTIGYFYLIGDRKRALNLFIIIFISHILSIPLIVYTIKQVTSTYYWESMERGGLVYTHLPAANVFYSGVWVLLALLFFALAYFWMKEFRDDEDYKNLFVFSALSGLAMLLTSVSNIVTGKEMENSQHIERFIGVWLVIVFVGLVFCLLRNKAGLRGLIIWQRLILFVLFLFCLAGIIRYVRVLGGSNFFLFYISRIGNQQANITAQNYSGVLGWLENNEKEQKVIWVIPYSSSINNYLTVLTKHYSLFAASGENYLVSQKEVEERYLTVNYFNNLSQGNIENAFRDYGGTGNAVHRFKTHNRQVKICQILHLNLFNYDCAQEVADATSFKGKQYFIDLYNQYKNEITPNINRELKKFNISYILVDKANNPSIDAARITGLNIVYQDKDFIIYKILDSNFFNE